MKYRLFSMLAGLLVSAQVLAAPAAVVEGLQMPVWLERGGQRAPLKVGMALQGGDVLHSGPGARVLLLLEEGSHVKLGENADLDLATLEPPADTRGVFKGLMNVLKGAFRFTTSALGKHRSRDIEARIASVTIGIRGTDVWGKAAIDRDFVVLLEGKIDIRRNDEPMQHMAQAMTLFNAPKGAPVPPIAPVDREQLKVWAQETELQDGGGVIKSGGAWTLNLASYRQHTGAAEMSVKLGKAGYAVGEETVGVNGTRWTRLTIGGFASRNDAGAAAKLLATQFGFTAPWVTRSR